MRALFALVSSCKNVLIVSALRQLRRPFLNVMIEAIPLNQSVITPEAGISRIRNKTDYHTTVDSKNLGRCDV